MRWIYLDLDDVLCETTPALSRLHAERTGCRVELEEMRSFDLRISLGLSETEYHSFMHAAHEPRFLESMDPVHGAGEQIESWRALGFKIAVLTGRPPSSEAATRRWLENHAIGHDVLHMVDKYGRPDWHGEAARPALSLEDLGAFRFELAVEDSLAMAQFLAVQLRTPVLLLDRPWNREPAPGAPAGEGAAPIRRVRELAEVGRHLTRAGA